MKYHLIALVLLFGTACSEVENADPGVVAMRLDSAGLSFYDMPYPNDLLLNPAARTVDLSRFPNPKNNDAVAQAIRRSEEFRSGFPQLPLVSIGFDGEVNLAGLIADDATVPEPNYPLYFLNIDPSSKRYGEMVPAIGFYFLQDKIYVEDNVLTMAPWGGYALAPGAVHAAIVERSLKDADGRPLKVNGALSAALEGAAGEGTAAALSSLYAPLRAYLAGHKGLQERIAAATVFTTNDPAQDMADLMQSVTSDYDATLEQAFTATYDDADFCYLHGKLGFPQFQTGDAPYAKEDSGLLQFDSTGKPVLQRWEEVDTVFVIPNRVMPAGGFPYVEYIHGSGGVANQVVHRGINEGDGNTPWRGPGWWLAKRGIASGSQAMPISPDRVPDVGDYDYFQLTNLAASRGNFQQGVVEEGLKREYLRSVTFSSSLCPGVTSTDGTIRFAADDIGVTGQSMGAMYVNLFASIATDVSVMLPTGSGGYWAYFIFSTEFLPSGTADLLLGPLLGAPLSEDVSPMHPVMGIVEHFLEAIDPIFFLSRIQREPLPGGKAKHLWVPFGYRDSYFSPGSQRAMAANYGVPLMGPAVDPLMEPLLNYYYGFDAVEAPVQDNLTGGDDSTVTGVQVQFEEDLVTEDGHYIVFQRPEVTRQFGCFAESVLVEGQPVAVAADVKDANAGCD